MQKETTLALLRKMLGSGAEFRGRQWEAIDRAANRRRRLLVVQRTGWGKSVVYSLASQILRDAGAGPTLLISPLTLLMPHQILAAEKLGIRAATIHSENLEEWAQVETALQANQVDVLLAARPRQKQTRRERPLRLTHLPPPKADEKDPQPDGQPQTDQRMTVDGWPGNGLAALGLCMAATALHRLKSLNPL